MTNNEKKLEEIDYDISDLDYRVKDLESNLENIDNKIKELKNTRDEYELYLYPNTIKKYLENLIKLQIKGNSFFPSDEKFIEDYFKQNFEDFDFSKIKYSKDVDLKLCSEIISDMGKSGMSYIDNIKNVIDINKPLLLFYGIEQLSAYYMNIHFNFLWLNTNLNNIKDKMQHHGIDPFEFNDELDLNKDFDIFLNKKIRLEKFGFAQRFFLTFSPQVLKYFTERKTISFLNLLQLFYSKCNVPSKISKKFFETYGITKEKTKRDLIFLNNKNSNLFIIYLLSFLFGHLCRYKMHTWTGLLECDIKNIKYYIKYFLEFSNSYYIKLIFDNLYENEERIKGFFSLSSSLLI